MYRCEPDGAIAYTPWFTLAVLNPVMTAPEVALTAAMFLRLELPTVENTPPM